MNRYEVDTKFKPAFMGHIPPDDIRKKYARLEQAVRSRDEVLVKHLVEDNTPVNHLFPFGSLTPLHLAVQSRSLEIAKILLDKGADVNAKSLNGDTPLTLAAKTGNLALIDLLLSYDVGHEKDDFNLSHFHIACMRNRVDIVRKLVSINQWMYLNEFVDENSIVCQDYSPLHCAVYFGCVETVEYLLKCKANMMAKNSHGLTPLHLADLQRNEKIIDLLLSAQKYEIKNPFSKLGLSHFHIACTRDDTSIVKHFLESGVDVDLQTEAFTKGPWISWRPLNFAIYYNCPRVIELLLRAGAHMKHPIHTLLAYESIRGNEEIYDLLHTAVVKSQKVRDKGYEVLNSFVKTCSYDESSYGLCYRALSDLMNYGPLDINVPLRTGGSVLHLVVDCNNDLAVVNFINRGADLMMQDHRGQTPLHVAYYKRHSEIFDTIVKRMISHSLHNRVQNLTDNKGLSLFHILCTTNDLNLLKKYLALGVNVNAQVGDESELWAGYTPLHFACSHLKADVVELLLQNDADISITNKIGLNPFDLIVEKMVLRVTLKHGSHFRIYQSILQFLQHTTTKNLNTRGISLLHSLCFNSRSDKENLDRLRQYLITNQHEINGTIKLDKKHFYNKCTPLHLAMVFGNWQKAQLLLEYGADPLMVNSEGRTPLECAFREGCDKHKLAEYAPTLLTFEMVNQTTKPSHFHIACALGYFDMVKRVLEVQTEMGKRILLGSRDNRGRSPLHSLLDQQINANNLVKKQIILLLLKNGADVNARDYELRTPLYFANHPGDADIIQLLIDHGADINSRDVYGNVILSQFMTNKSAKEIAVLLNNGVDINVMNIDGQTPLREMVCNLSRQISLNPENWGSDCVIFLLKHTKKLELAGWNVNKENKKAYADLLRYVDEWFKDARFIDECENELQLMEMDRYSPLYGILSKNVNQMALYCENIDLQNIVKSDGFLQRFPIYGHLVRLQLKNGVIRRSLLMKASKAMISLIEKHLPESCMEAILYKLSNSDLKNIILSVRDLEID
ncbi:hypothetical protein QAD02_010072 [Eretmocerus hayati]|uniref:Uncharacterized protein n=1 Tax=Eretmocerus hayati TaxID=131215 RepID=A0ACC2NB13_9HYME|nr:hypothetical protein QAD02_010072 [Eretmocerus hayati]